MPRFYFDVVNRTGFVPDGEGMELADAAAARAAAIDSIRSILAEEARRGLVDLRGHVDVRGEAGAFCRIGFAEAVEVLTGDAAAADEADGEERG